MHGVVFSGLSSPFFCGESNWGRSIRLQSGEELQLKLWPRGCFSSGQIVGGSGNNLVMIASRRSGSRIKDCVSFALLWNVTPLPGQMEGLAHDSVNNGTQGCRNVHIVLPSLFNHHDATAQSSPGVESRLYPLLDEQNYHAVRPSTVTITQNPSFQHKNSISTGLSQFVIGGHFAGVSEIEDVVHRSAEPVPVSKWKAVTQCYAQKLHGQHGTSHGIAAMHSAYCAMDMLTCEGLLSILSHQFSDGALPDMLHLPLGFPLLITFAVRVACFPERYKLAPPTTADLYGVREVTSLFESNWLHLNATDGADGSDDVHLYAIDAVIKSAYKDALNAACAAGARTAVVDNLCLWRRAGQRCISAAFGAQLQDYFPPEIPYGRVEALQCPLMEARVRTMKNSVAATDAANVVGDSAASLMLAAVKDKKHTLMLLMSSVEGWLRNGTYAGNQISKKNAPDLNEFVEEPEPQPTIYRKREFQHMLNVGVDQSLKEMLEEDKEIDELTARQHAEAIKQSIQSVLAQHPNDTKVCIGLGEERQEERQEEETKNYKAVAVKEAAHRHRPEAQARSRRSKLDNAHTEDVCIAAFMNASGALAAGLCQGPMVHHQFDMSCFLSSADARHTCADCDASVHLLPSTFLSTRFGHCPRCFRSRCVICESAAVKFAHEHGHVKGTDEGCLRCSADATTAATAATATTTEGGSSGLQGSSPKAGKKKKH
jgi:hypothetical protein